MRSFEAKPHLYDFSNQDGSSMIIGGSIDISLLRSGGAEVDLIAVPQDEPTEASDGSDENPASQS